MFVIKLNNRDIVVIQWLESLDVRIIQGVYYNLNV